MNVFVMDVKHIFVRKSQRRNKLTKYFQFLFSGVIMSEKTLFILERLNPPPNKNILTCDY